MSAPDPAAPLLRDEMQAILEGLHRDLIEVYSLDPYLRDPEVAAQADRALAHARSALGRAVFRRSKRPLTLRERLSGRRRWL